MVVVESIEDIQLYLKEKKQFYILGKGSNTVLSETHSYDDILKISPQCFPVECTGNTLCVGAGIAVNELIKASQHYELSGLEFMAGVPASVGGMVAMNFGCWGFDISQILQSVTVITYEGELKTLSNSDCCFSYRDSIFQHEPFIVLTAEFQLQKGDSHVIKNLIKKNINKRLASQPLRGLTFGSIFRNPTGQHAAQILDDLGLKGYGNEFVKLSEQHANFMINKGQAKMEHVQAFIGFLQQKVKNKTGFLLEPEVKLVN